MTKLVIPKHVGYIMDGNRRWAKKYGVPTYEGHLAGYNAIQEVAIATFNSGVEFVSIYSFSTENWKRSKDEVKKLMGLALKLFTSDLPLFDKNNIKLKVLGSMENVNKRIVRAIKNAEVRTSKNSAGTLAICFNYGGQLEIVDAVKKTMESGASIDDMSVGLIEQNLYTPEIPPMDLIVRTGGQHRLSNFMLWRSAYSEIMFMDKLWPDMKKTDAKEAIKEFNKRVRRFGE